MYSKRSETHRIIATLEWGVLFPIWTRILFYIFQIVICAIPLIFIFDNSDGILNFYEITGIMVALLFVAFFAFILIYDAKHRKSVTLWLQDAVETNIYLVKLGKIDGAVVAKGLRIGGNLTFKARIKYDNNTITLIANTNLTMDGKKKFISFSKPLCRLCDKQLVALYSPKYKQVLFIQQPTDNKYSTKEIK